MVRSLQALEASMALPARLEQAGKAPEQISTTARVTLEKTPEGWRVVRSHLRVEAEVPGMDPQLFENAAQEAKAGCPISRLANAEITLETQLKQRAA